MIRAILAGLLALAATVGACLAVVGWAEFVPRLLPDSPEPQRYTFDERSDVMAHKLSARAVAASPVVAVFAVFCLYAFLPRRVSPITGAFLGVAVVSAYWLVVPIVVLARGGEDIYAYVIIGSLTVACPIAMARFFASVLVKRPIDGSKPEHGNV
ncbi:MAG TPA: hypothetical protein VNA25_11680 [Phycisphaerae bacterium]|nr:hypothetical protein [Phycisphaerae bacterium]